MDRFPSPGKPPSPGCFGFVVREGLTPMGQEAAGHIEALTDWIEDSLPRIIDVRAQHASWKSAPASGGAGRAGRREPVP
ncbi:MAG TPA: hypothetical protein VEU33_44880 [Archangium sp.]|nr:hypothetical protein [Archangium sp.]